MKLASKMILFMNKAAPDYLQHELFAEAPNEQAQ
jgi:hypothetical protein